MNVYVAITLIIVALVLGACMGAFIVAIAVAAARADEAGTQLAERHRSFP